MTDKSFFVACLHQRPSEKNVLSSFLSYYEKMYWKHITIQNNFWLVISLFSSEKASIAEAVLWMVLCCLDIILMTCQKKAFLLTSHGKHASHFCDCSGSQAKKWYLNHSIIAILEFWSFSIDRNCTGVWKAWKLHDW